MAKRETPCYPPRHCEERSDAAIHAAVQSPETLEPTYKAAWIATGLRPSP